MMKLKLITKNKLLSKDISKTEVKIAEQKKVVSTTRDDLGLMYSNTTYRL